MTFEQGHVHVQVTHDICGRSSAGLQLSHQGQTIQFIQQFHEASRNKVQLLTLERSSCNELILLQSRLLSWQRKELML